MSRYRSGLGARKCAIAYLARFGPRSSGQSSGGLLMKERSQPSGKRSDYRNIGPRLPRRTRSPKNLLAAERRLVRIGDFVFHVDSIDDLKSRIKARKTANPRIDVAGFKEITGGLTRKYAIPLLEYLDRERITRRIGNEREIL